MTGCVPKLEFETHSELQAVKPTKEDKGLDGFFGFTKHFFCFVFIILLMQIFNLLVNCFA